MTTIVGTLRKIEYENDESYYIQSIYGGVFNLTNKFSDSPDLEQYLEKVGLTWDVLDWNFMADREDQRYKVSGIRKDKE
jgi:hypothetical protein